MVLNEVKYIFLFNNLNNYGLKNFIGVMNNNVWSRKNLSEILKIFLSNT